MRSILGVSHLAIAAHDPAGAAADYARLLQSVPLPVRDADGGSGFWFDTANQSVLLRSPAHDEATGLAALVFRVAEFSRTCVEFARCGVPLAAVLEQIWTSDTGRALRWQEAALMPAASHGMPLAVADRSPTNGGTGVGLDHIVIRTRDPERAIALYGGRLGLDMRLDRTNPAWNARFLFFRCGDLVVEVVHPLSDAGADKRDAFGGLSWRVPDIAVAQTQLADGGVAVSEIRTGRRPGSRVFTVRSHAAGVPTIMLGLTPRAG